MFELLGLAWLVAQSAIAVLLFVGCFLFVMFCFTALIDISR